VTGVIPGVSVGYRPGRPKGRRQRSGDSSATSTTFREAIRDVRTELTGAIDVSDLLLGHLRDKGMLTKEQYDRIRVRRYIGLSV